MRKRIQEVITDNGLTKAQILSVLEGDGFEYRSFADKIGKPNTDIFQDLELVIK